MSEPEQLPQETPAAHEHAEKPKRQYKRRGKAEAPDTSFDPGQLEQPSTGGIDFQKLMEQDQAAAHQMETRAAQERAAEATAQGNGHPEAAPRKPWVQVAGYWRENEAGVRIEEDRKNGLTTILFREVAPAKAQQVLGQAGYVKEDQHTFSKKIDRLRRIEHREDAENLLLTVDNIVREGKGLPAKDSFFISRA